MNIALKFFVGLRPIALVLFAWGVVAAHSQSIAPDATEYRVTGIVLDAVRSTPIAGALVQIDGSQQFSTLSKRDGSFQVPGVSGGSHKIEARKPGFMLGADPSSPYLEIAVGPNTRRVRIQLTSQPLIFGRISDEHGRPVQGISVHAVREGIFEGYKRWLEIGGPPALTDETGAYRIANLWPGSYIVFTDSKGAFWENSTMGRPHVVLQAYRREFYPRVFNPVDARPIRLHAGQEAKADFELRTGAAFHVSGTLSGVQRGWQFTLREPNGFEVPWSTAQWTDAAHFSIPLVFSGRNVLKFWSSALDGPQWYGEQAIDVAQENIQGVTVAMQPIPPIAVHVKSTAASNLTAGNEPPLLDMQLFRRGGFGRGDLSTPGTVLGRMAFRNVSPDRYRVKLASATPGQCVVSATAGTTDLIRSDLVVAAGVAPPPIEVQLGSDCANLTGKVKLAGAVERSRNRFIVILQAAIAPEACILVPIQPDGAFIAYDLPPGLYRVYAFSNVLDLEYTNPDVLRAFPAQEVKLEAHQTTHADVPLLIRSNE